MRPLSCSCRYRLAGGVEVAGGRDVHADRIAEEPELGSEPGVEIKQLVLACLLVPAQIEITDSAIAEPGQQRGDLVAQPDVQRGAPEGGQAGVRRIPDAEP